jgi:hypothetical protein
MSDMARPPCLPNIRRIHRDSHRLLARQFRLVVRSRFLLSFRCHNVSNTQPAMNCVMRNYSDTQTLNMGLKWVQCPLLAQDGIG